jgi:hypothetical protein
LGWVAVVEIQGSGVRFSAHGARQTISDLSPRRGTPYLPSFILPIPVCCGPFPKPLWTAPAHSASDAPCARIGLVVSLFKRHNRLFDAALPAYAQFFHNNLRVGVRGQQKAHGQTLSGASFGSYPSPCACFAYDWGLSSDLSAQFGIETLRNAGIANI